MSATDCRRSSNLCPRCGGQHLPATMVSEVVADLKRRWGMSLAEVYAELRCSAFAGMEGRAIMRVLQEAATYKLQREGLQ